jgi:hypothetical protein
MSALYPETGAWTRFLTWFGMVDSAPPEYPPDDELDQIVRVNFAATLLRYSRESGINLSPNATRILNGAVFSRQTQSHAIVSSAKPAIQRLQDSGIDFVVMKGPGVAACYPEGEARSFGDLDVLVRPSAFSKAMRLLEELNWKQHREDEQTWPFFDRWCREGVNLSGGDQPGNIDLHHRPSPWLWSTRMEFGELCARATEADWFGTKLPCLSAEDNLLVCALQIINEHTAPGGKLSAWRDLGMLARAVDPRGAAAVARRAKLADFLIAILSGVPDGVVPAPLTAELMKVRTGRIPHARRLALVADLNRATSRPLTTSHALRLGGPSASLYVLGTTFPSPSYLRARTPGGHANYFDWWRSAVRNHGLVR